MVAAPASAVFSLRSKLIVAFVAIVLVALMIAAFIFVLARRGEQEQNELDHVIAASPTIYAVFSVLEERRAAPGVMLEFVESAAAGFDLRVLLVDRPGGVVVADSEERLTGEQIALPDELLVSQHGPGPRPYVSWEPEGGSPGSGLILVSASVGRNLGPFSPSPDERYRLLLAVPQATIRDAWRGLLPALGVAALIAIPAAVLLAIVVARYITGPLQQLTRASQQMAEGTFDVEVSVDRRDEVGRLAQSFSTMAHRVGEAHAEMRALVASVSHDLKTPLTSILGFAQALRDGGAPTDEEARRLGGVIHEEATRLNTRLDDLLYLSEIESRQAVLDRDEIDVGRLVRGVLARIEEQLGDRDIQLGLDLAAGLTVTADGPKLERAVENLLENSRRHTPSGGEIRVRSAREGGRAVIAVTNSAPDLNTDELPRLFERFYRRDRMRGARSGSGLGLPIARDLIELHGGTLEAAVTDGEVTFAIMLPLLEGRAALDTVAPER